MRCCAGLPEMVRGPPLERREEALPGGDASLRISREGVAKG